MIRYWTQEQKAKACAEILVRIRSGRSLLAACKNGDDWTPTESTFRDWCKEDADLAANYTCAREARAELIFEQCLTIADSQEGDVVIVDGVEQTNHDAIARAKLKIDTRKWMLGKMQPRVYGDKVILGSDPDNPLPEHKTIVATMTPQEAAEAYASTLSADKG